MKYRKMTFVAATVVAAALSHAAVEPGTLTTQVAGSVSAEPDFPPGLKLAEHVQSDSDKAQLSARVNLDGLANIAGNIIDHSGESIEQLAKQPAVSSGLGEMTDALQTTRRSSRLKAQNKGKVTAWVDDSSDLDSDAEGSLVLKNKNNARPVGKGSRAKRRTEEEKAATRTARNARKWEVRKRRLNSTDPQDMLWAEKYRMWRKKGQLNYYAKFEKQFSPKYLRMHGLRLWQTKGTRTPRPVHPQASPSSSEQSLPEEGVGEETKALWRHLFDDSAAPTPQGSPASSSQIRSPATPATPVAHEVGTEVRNKWKDLFGDDLDYQDEVGTAAESAHSTT